MLWLFTGKQVPGGYSGFQVTVVIEGFSFFLGGGVEIFHSGCFWVGKFGKYFFGWLDLSRDFLGIQNNLKNCGNACVSWPRSSANIKYWHPNLFCGCFNYILRWCHITLYLFHKTGYTIVRKVSRVYFTRLQFIQLISHPSCLSPGFILTGIPFCCSEFLISFACDLWVNPFWKFWGSKFRHGILGG